MNTNDRGGDSSSDTFDLGAALEDDGNGGNGNAAAANDEDYDGVDGGGTPSSHFMEGYTPLNFNMNALVIMDDDDDDDESNIDEDDNVANNGGGDMDGDMFANGYYHMMGAPPKRLNGVKDHVIRSARLPHPHGEEEYVASSGADDGSDSSRGHGDADAGSAESGSGGIVPDDFRLLAEQALRGLEIEHSSTLDVIPGSIIASSTPKTENKNAAMELSDFETCFASFDEKQNDGPNIQVDEQISIDSEQVPKEKPDASVKETKPAALPKIQLKDPKPLKSGSMNVNAIQNAMKSIRLKSPQLATTLDAGGSSSFSSAAAHVATDEALVAIINSTSQAIEKSRQPQDQLTSHSIIPAGPLAAFRRTTPKAQTASSNLTRSGTLSEAVLRLWPLICFRRRMRSMGLGGSSRKTNQTDPYSKTLTIHILGCDGVECSSEELVHKSVGSFVRWMDAALRSGAFGSDASPEKVVSVAQSTGIINSLLIEFSGPNMPNALLGKAVDLLSQSKTQSGGLGLVSAKAIFQQREYHERPSGNTDAMPEADIAIAFNAGIWGYDSWKPTLAYMCSAKSESNDDGINGSNSGIGKTLFIITAYTVEECEDDAEVVAEVVEEAASERSSSPANKGPIARQLWAPESNPFSSRLERKTASAPPGRKYFENGAWQAWLLGL